MPWSSPQWLTHLVISAGHCNGRRGGDGDAGGCAARAGQSHPVYLCPPIQGQAKPFLLAVECQDWVPLIVMMTCSFICLYPAGWRTAAKTSVCPGLLLVGSDSACFPALGGLGCPHAPFLRQGEAASAPAAQFQLRAGLTSLLKSALHGQMVQLEGAQGWSSVLRSVLQFLALAAQLKLCSILLKRSTIHVLRLAISISCSEQRDQHYPHIAERWLTANHPSAKALWTSDRDSDATNPKQPNSMGLG